VDVIIARLDSLPDELKGELARVDTAYREMLDAEPGGGGGASGSVSL